MKNYFQFQMTIILLFLMYGCEGCPKKYLLTGRITEDGSPVSDVIISWVGSDVAIKTTTDSNGVYQIQYEVMGNFESRQLQFSKVGYSSITAVPYTKSEAGQEKCGSRTLVRDVSLIKEEP